MDVGTGVQMLFCDCSGSGMAGHPLGQTRACHLPAQAVHRCTPARLHMAGRGGTPQPVHSHTPAAHARCPCKACWPLWHPMHHDACMCKMLAMQPVPERAARSCRAGPPVSRTVFSMWRATSAAARTGSCLHACQMHVPLLARFLAGIRKSSLAALRKGPSSH